ncbi:type II toxin-antitoxin system VapC family toxin [Coleofasciculus sp. H7-2]|uniref:type II toxin-antitoxin system VapC family toxin n=1 Tax=Coleofasciculus sp. H7-2 TaxID=3351545 RepID=UPI00366B0EA0
MSLWVLDTDIVSLFQQGHLLVNQRVNAVNPEEIGVTIITVEEQMYGRLNSIRRANSPEALISAYARLAATLNYFRTVNLLDFDQDAGNCYAELVRQRVRIGTQDLRIAAIAISRNGILVTRNRQDFARIPSLNLEDWTIDELS